MEGESDIGAIIRDLKSYPGYTRKRVIGQWVNGLLQKACEMPLADVIPIGDDTGGVRFGDEYLLCSAEAIFPPLFDDPYFAGFCSVVVCVNDIYAMGGHPLGILLVVYAGGFDDRTRGLFIDGFSSGLRHYSLPLLGGHTSPEGEERFAAVAIVGLGKHLLRGDGAKAGDEIIVAVDLDGRKHPSYYAWDTVMGASPDETQSKLSALSKVSKNHLCTSCRDISNPGIIGTLAMLLEASSCGGRVCLERIPVPQGVELNWWLKAYPSYGFVLTCPPEEVNRVSGIFDDSNIACATIGEVIREKVFYLSLSGDEKVFVDYRKESVTAIRHFGA